MLLIYRSQLKKNLSSCYYHQHWDLHRWSGRWKSGDGRAWGVLVLLCALPQIFMCMVSYVSWVGLGVSLVLGAGAILKGEKAA